MNINKQEKIYIRGTKNSKEKKNVTYKIGINHLDFLDLFIKLKQQQGYHRLAYTRTDILENAIQHFCDVNKEEIIKYANPKLKKMFDDNKIFNP